jgi:hypothetical protein
MDYPSLTIYKGTESSIANRNWPNAGDNDTTTKYCSAFRNSAYFLFDAQEMVIPFGYRIYTANDTRTYPDRNPISWRLYGSNVYTENPNDECWELIDERINDYTLEATNFTPYDFLLKTEDSETSLSEELRMKSEEGLARQPEGESQSPNAVYDLSGRKINSQLSTVNSQLILKKGIYIVNGKKVFRK